MRYLLCVVLLFSFIGVAAADSEPDTTSVLGPTLYVYEAFLRQADATSVTVVGLPLPFHLPDGSLAPRRFLFDNSRIETVRPWFRINWTEGYGLAAGSRRGTISKNAEITFGRIPEAQLSVRIVEEHAAEGDTLPGVIYDREWSSQLLQLAVQTMAASISRLDSAEAAVATQQHLLAERQRLPPE